MKMPGAAATNSDAGLIQRTDELIIAHYTPASNCPAIIPPYRIDLCGILQEDAGLFAVFTAGPSQRVVPVDRSDLTTFEAFRVRVAAYLSIRIAFAGDWADAVVVAFQRGGEL